MPTIFIWFVQTFVYDSRKCYPFFKATLCLEESNALLPEKHCFLQGED